ncbi:hypothetical protein ACWCOV_19355 [Kribbella sp. NPDC002412]
MNKWFYLAAAIGSEVAATPALKAALDQPLWHGVVAADPTGCYRWGLAVGWDRQAITTVLRPGR